MRSCLPLFLSALAFSSCDGQRGNVPLDLLLDDAVIRVDYSVGELKDLLGPTATLFLTLDPECPMTLGYVPLLDSLQHELPPGVRMVGLYTGPFIARDSAAFFARQHHLDFAQVMDPECVLANALHARVTPEAFLVATDGTVLYRGALDDSAVREGRKRTASQHYVVEALRAIATGKDQPTAEVPALGCIVECDNEVPQ